MFDVLHKITTDKDSERERRDKDHAFLELIIQTYMQTLVETRVNSKQFLENRGGEDF